MKTISIICCLFIVLSCKDGSEKAKTDEVPSVEIVSKDAQGGSALTQKGDYSELFLWEEENCDFITQEEIAKVLGITTDTIEPETNGCGYKVTETDGNGSRFYFKHENWKKNEILSQINGSMENMESLGEDSRLTHIQVSETGDTYLAMNQNRYIMILNENYAGVIAIDYKAVIEQGEKDVAVINNKMDTALNRTYALANYLLKKYQK